MGLGKVAPAPVSARPDFEAPLSALPALEAGGRSPARHARVRPRTQARRIVGRVMAGLRGEWKLLRKLGLPREKREAAGIARCRPPDHPSHGLRSVAGERLPPGLEGRQARSEEHTSELQSQSKLECRLLLQN